MAKEEARLRGLLAAAAVDATRQHEAEVAAHDRRQRAVHRAEHRGEDAAAQLIVAQERIEELMDENDNLTGELSKKTALHEELQNQLRDCHRDLTIACRRSDAGQLLAADVGLHPGNLTAPDCAGASVSGGCTVLEIDLGETYCCPHCWGPP